MELGKAVDTLGFQSPAINPGSMSGTLQGLIRVLFPGLPGLEQPFFRLEGSGFGRAAAVGVMRIGALKPLARVPFKAVISPLADEEVAMWIQAVTLVNGQGIGQGTSGIHRRPG